MDSGDVRSSKFMQFYKNIGAVAEDEWEEFNTACSTAPPVVFRFVQENRRCKSRMKEGMTKHSIILRDYMKEVILPKLANTEINGKQVEVKPFSWYPGELAFQINFTAPDLRAFAAVKDMCEFLVSETAGYNVLRQEVLSMLPPLLLDVQPHHKILDLCTAPGWMASQILEMLYAGDEENEQGGFLIANDVESNRIQWRWTKGTECLFMKNDGRYLPDLYTSSEISEETRLQYDRVVVDAPCSRDGSMRKNVNLRGQWTGSAGMNNHKTQKKLLQRGLELLCVGGKLLYSTSSMNPVENEAVVISMLKLAPNALELVDVKHMIPGFKCTGGMTKWKVMGSSSEFYETIEEASAFFKDQYEDTVFPPPADTVDNFHLDRCVRVLPHYNDTEGFFCAVFEKKSELPWIITKVAADAAKANNTSTELTEVPVKRVKYSGDRPLRVMTDVCISALEWETKTVNEDGETVISTEKQEFEQPPIRLVPERKHAQREDDKEKEELCSFMDPENEVWKKVKDLYKISDDLDPSLLSTRMKEADWYLTTPALKSILNFNKDRRNVKFMKTYGLKCFSQYKHKLTPDCDITLSNQGILAMFPYIGARILKVNKKDMLQLLVKKSVPFSKLDADLQKQLEDLTPGCIVLHYTPTESEPEPNTEIILVGWRDHNWLCDHIGSKFDTAHYVRLFGKEVQDVKKELRAAEDSSSTTTVKLEIMETDGDAENGDDVNTSTTSADGDKAPEKQEEESVD